LNPKALRNRLSNLIKTRAQKLNLSHCGICKAVFLEKEKQRLEDWLAAGMHGDMLFMEKNTDKRLHPALLVDQAKSVISVSLNYYPLQIMDTTDNYKIAKYAYGKDYHDIIKNKLNQLILYIRTIAGQVNARAFTDTAPVLEKALAQNGGLGWIGKNSCLINEKMGSFFFLGEIITDLDIDPDNPAQERCGNCTKCIDACPTGAIVKPYIIDAKKCIAYLTIEYRKNLPANLKNNFQQWIFGCDICQDICPWNKFSRPHLEPAFHPCRALFNMRKKDWDDLSEDEFKKIFLKSPLKRTAYNGLKRNIDFVRNK
jgi:epoxyqueuosine reductase